MALPVPLPDDPKRWEGWRAYTSSNFYERLGFKVEERPTNAQIEDAALQVMIWWQKKLPLKSQTGNPLSQMLGKGIDDAPRAIAEAKAALLDPATRAKHDEQVKEIIKSQAKAELKKFILFALSDKILTREEESNLISSGKSLGLSENETQLEIELALKETSSKRGQSSNASSGLEEEFQKLLSMMLENVNSLTPVQEADLIRAAQRMGIHQKRAREIVLERLKTLKAAARPGSSSAREPQQKPAGRTSEPVAARIEPAKELSREEEIAKFAPFTTSQGIEMVYVPGGAFLMGSSDSDAFSNEQPLTNVKLTGYYISKHPITNGQFELFDPKHKVKRLPDADERHPVVYVNWREATAFCEWLSSREGKIFRLPSEAEWEYSARGTDRRKYPWGNEFSRVACCNFADLRTNFAWSDKGIDDGFEKTSPVGSFPKGASAFGVEDLAGNVWEWCRDRYGNYSGGIQENPLGSGPGSDYVFRGGSWRSKAIDVRATRRHHHTADYSFMDIGFRVACVPKQK